MFSTLTVEENLTLTFRQVFGRSGSARALQQAYDQFPRLGERRQQVAGTLSGGEQRMLSLARVLVHEPKLLITDELSLGLAPVIIDEVYRTLATIRDAGTSLLIVEQHVHQALTLADDVVVVAKGRVDAVRPGRRARRRQRTPAPRRPRRASAGNGAADASEPRTRTGPPRRAAPSCVAVGLIATSTSDGTSPSTISEHGPVLEDRAGHRAPGGCRASAP